MTQSNEDTKRTAHDVELPAVARNAGGFSETWYFRRNGDIVAHAGDSETVGAGWMLEYDLNDDDQATVLEGLDADELPTEFAPVATDGGDRDD
jgi:hypothetical protein